MNLNKNDSHLDVEPYKRLAAAVILQAVKDARSKSKNTKLRDEAIAFLKKSDLIVALGLDRDYLLNKVYESIKDKEEKKI